MSDPLEQAEDATPLSSEERTGLIPSHIALRRELNELERQNIVEAEAWAFSRKRNLYSEPFLRSLHRRMYNKVWRWAGRYRGSEKNIGVEHWLIQPRLAEVLGNTRYWVDHETYPAEEIAVRFHHALVAVHPFANGNGRWSRLMADLLVVQLDRPRFTWGRSELRAADETRKAYIEALRKADEHDLVPLVVFARS